MNSRERVMYAANRALPDRTPADYKGDPEINQAVMQRLQTNTYDELLDKLNVDVRRIYPRYVGSPSKVLEGGITEDYWGIRAQTLKASHGTYDMFVETALFAATTLEDLEKHNWPTPDIFDYSVMAEQIERYPEHAIMYEGSDLFTRPSILRGMENLMMDMMCQPEMAHYIFEKFTTFYCEDLTRALEATKGKFQLYCQWSDYGTQQALLVSVPMWREFIGPYLKRLVDVCHSGGVKFMAHSCGAIRQIIPDMIEVGVDMLDPIQTMAVGMEPAGLKRDFGDKLCFHGGICTQSTLPFGSSEDVRNEVIDRVKTLGDNGGYIIAPSHNMQPDTPVDNVLAMYDMSLRKI